ncbi:MAG: hypothetical protein V3W18_05080 [candidate division Zixibacteria bacterium]
MFRKLLSVILGGALCMIAIGDNPLAQESASIQSIATVVSTLSVNGTNDIQFQTVSLGINKSVDKTDVGLAGEWTVSGQSGEEVTLDFVVPVNLTSGANNLAISFSNIDASYANDPLNDQSNPTAAIDPVVVTTTNLGAGGGLMVWIGATVNPTAGQASGAYSGTVELLVTLTGN